jgi:hypothetical protein
MRHRRGADKARAQGSNTRLTARGRSSSARTRSSGIFAASTALCDQNLECATGKKRVGRVVSACKPAVAGERAAQMRTGHRRRQRYCAGPACCVRGSSRNSRDEFAHVPIVELRLLELPLADAQGVRAHKLHAASGWRVHGQVQVYNLFFLAAYGQGAG